MPCRPSVTARKTRMRRIIGAAHGTQALQLAGHLRQAYIYIIGRGSNSSLSIELVNTRIEEVGCLQACKAASHPYLVTEGRLVYPGPVVHVPVGKCTLHACEHGEGEQLM